MSQTIDYFAPRTLAEALDVLAAGPATVLAGGTDLMPQTHSGKRKLGGRLMNIRRIAELAGISESGGVVRIGALTTISELYEHALVRERLPVLWSACDHFASGQIRNAGTLGGNVCNASPAGDTLVPLLVLGATVVLASAARRGTPRRVPLADFLLGPGRTGDQHALQDQGAGGAQRRRGRDQHRGCGHSGGPCCRSCCRDSQWLLTRCSW